MLGLSLSSSDILQLFIVRIVLAVRKCNSFFERERSRPGTDLQSENAFPGLGLFNNQDLLVQRSTHFYRSHLGVRHRLIILKLPVV